MLRQHIYALEHARINHVSAFATHCDLWNFALQGERLVGALSSIKARAPVTGGNFGVWGGMFSTFDCAVKGYRQKEDAWNGIISGFMTGGCLALRSESFSLYTQNADDGIGGPKATLGSAIACGILLGVFEGIGVLLSRTMGEVNRPIAPSRTSSG